MTKIILKTGLISIPFFFILVSTNYYVDPAKRFNSIYEQKIVDIFLRGKYATNISNYDERLVIHKLAQQRTKKADILILGSSRSMLINQSHFGDFEVFNGSVSSACLQDLIINYQIMKDNDMLPEKKIILGIDPWTFNDNNNEKRWKWNESKYNKFFKKDTKVIRLIESNTFSKYHELISLSYFQSSIRYFFKTDVLLYFPTETSVKYNTTKTRLTDNSIVYNESVRTADKNTITKKAKKYIQNGMYMIDDFHKPSVTLVKQFETLILDIKNNNIEIEFFMAPYHPIVYKVIKKKYASVIKVENYISQYASENNIKIYGSFNPETIGLHTNHFYDGMHCNENGIKQILSFE